jgi:DNA-binding LacI/PurR family transcriptional regulator
MPRSTKTARKSTRSKPKSSRDKVRAYRARMRAQGLKPVQMWLPDMNSPEFKAEAHRQSLAAARSPTEREDQAFIDAITDLDALYERRRD